MPSSGGTRPFGRTLAALVWWHGGRRSDTVMTADGPWSGAEYPAMRAIASPVPCHRRHTERRFGARSLRPLLVTQHVMLTIEAVRGRQAGGVVLPARYAPRAARCCRGPCYRQFVVVASGLSWAAVLVAVAGSPGTG